MNHCLKVLDFGISYGKQPILDGVDFQVERGGITAIVGPSGCGKTSMLHSLTQMNDHLDVSQKGQISWRFKDGTGEGLDPRDLRLKVGMIFQKPNPFPVSIRKNLDIPMKEHRRSLSKADRSSIVEATLKKVGLWNEVSDRLDDSALLLSGGQQQRLCLARALVLEPEVLLLDEPCSALDPLATGVIEDLLRELSMTMTLVIVTHNLQQARRLSDQILLFWHDGDKGFLADSGTADELGCRSENQITRAYFSGERG